ncbi:MAG: biopolymer transporter ExbD [Myxococcota bacterium]|jgi:biopolymer transport protein ExbD|nr:biopolymer transporter ExbD [Myxococcota bacterium]
MAGTMKHSEDEIISDINVTPFVDVALVLLIIFMVTATYIIAQSIPVDLPKAATGEEVVATFAVTLTADGQTYLDGERIDESGLRKKIGLARARSADVRVIIAADASVVHGKVVRVIDLVRQEGVSKFAINIDSEDQRAATDEPAK